MGEQDTWEINIKINSKDVGHERVNEYFIRSVAVYTLWCRSLSPWSSVLVSHLNLLFLYNQTHLLFCHILVTRPRVQFDISASTM